MERFTQSRASEHKTKNSFKAEYTVDGIEPVKATSNQKSDEPPKFASRITILKTILLSVNSTIESWPRNVFEAVQKRFGRMPRGGWKNARDSFCEMFYCEIGEEVFKRGAHLIKRESLIDNSSPTGMRRRVNVQEQQFSSLLVSSVYMKLKIKFLNKIKSNPTITEFQSTRKIPEVKVNRNILLVLNHIAEEHILTNPPRTMCDIAKIL
ncbi:hypothetical protein TCON_2223 [Astathelohania contejeani]|uniref:Uncharacterized protein n=1 Tax=Astathelohania contejeani TaxID=164912 RepID=A0ABQ7HWK9_9MICR|nr:hypothetical protein TCON_2223 [Thelohania contejeani]